MSTRSELKENILASKLEGTVTWIIENRPKVLVGLGVTVAALLILSVFIARQSELKETRWTELARGEALFQQSQYPQAREVLTNIRGFNSGDPIYILSSFYLGQTALAEKKYDDAATYFTDIADKSGKSPVRPLALTNLGFAYEQKGDYASAAAAYQKFLDSYGEHFLAPRTQLALGRAFLMNGQKEEGKKQLQSLIDLYPTSEWAQKARSMMDK